MGGAHLLRRRRLGVDNQRRQDHRWRCSERHERRAPGTDGTRGGAIYNNGGTLTLNNVTVTSNKAGDGGAGMNGTNVVGGNGAEGGPGGNGGGAGSAGTLTVINSTMTGNVAGKGGNGGIGGSQATAGMNGGNGGNAAVGGAGGGIFAVGPLTLIGSTIGPDNVSGAGGSGGAGGTPGGCRDGMTGAGGTGNRGRERRRPLRLAVATMRPTRTIAKTAAGSAASADSGPLVHHGRPAPGGTAAGSSPQRPDDRQPADDCGQLDGQRRYRHASWRGRPGRRNRH